MSVDTTLRKPAPSVPRIRRQRLSTADKLRNALSNLTNGDAKFVQHHEKNWASITFAGTRHTIEMLFEGDATVHSAEQLIDDLPEHEFAIPGQIVADANVIEVDHQIGDAPYVMVKCELLLLEGS